MEEFWARFIEPSGQPGLNYWEYYAERLAQLATILNNSTILDLGTYDGNVLFKAMQKMKTLGLGIGADVYSGGFKDGIEDVKGQEVEKFIAFVQTDATALGFCAEQFDTVLANFIGWDDCFDFEQMKFRRPDTMMAEIKRVLRPGGQVGLGAWVEQSDIDWIIGVFKKCFPEADKNIVCYARENPEGQKIILQNSGFEDIQVQVETASFVLPDAEVWWRQMRQAASDYFRQITNPNTLQNFKEQVLVDLQQFQSPEGIRFSKTVSFALGTKPV